MVNIQDTYEIKCTIRDVSERGCKIVSSQIHEFPGEILVIPEGFEKPLRGKVVWRSAKMAGVCFADFDQSDDAHMGEPSNPIGEGPDDEDIFDLMAVKKPLGYAERLQRIRARR